jgi:hypothetical protein
VGTISFPFNNVANEFPGQPGDVPNLTFVANVRRLIGADRFELAPGHVLRRATVPEAQFLKAVMKRQGFASELGELRPWELAWTRGDGETEISRNLAPDEWYYHVIAFEGNNRSIWGLSAACRIARRPLHHAFSAMRFGTGGASGLSADTYRYPRHHDLPAFERGCCEVTPEDAEHISQLFQSLEAHDKTSIDVILYTRDLANVEALDPRSWFAVVGLFAIIESLLTHEPSRENPFDSIGHQLKKKIALLDNRWSPRLDYSVFEKGGAEQVWGQLYSYRSIVAHGGRPDFAGKKLNMLRSADVANAFLSGVARSLLRQALIEPRLLLDLREC